MSQKSIQNIYLLDFSLQRLIFLTWEGNCFSSLMKSLMVSFVFSDFLCPLEYVLELYQIRILEFTKEGNGRTE